MNKSFLFGLICLLYFIACYGCGVSQDPFFVNEVMVPTETAISNVEPSETLGSIPDALEEAHVHDYGCVVTAVTCVNAGYTTYTCLCGDSYIAEEIPSLGHDYVSVVFAPTVAIQGYTEHICSKCGDTFRDDYVDALPSVVFSDVHETVYATADVNIRTGPGVEHNKLGRLASGESITRIGIGDNGWSKVLYNNVEAYISSYYLSTEAPYVETVVEEMERRGNNGRLIIPSVGVNVALFDSSIYNVEHSQPIVDKDDSAAYLSDTIKYYGFIIIADHVHQGFSAIKKSVPGETYAYIDSGINKERYVCTDIFVGHNGYAGKYGLFDAWGNDIAGMNNGGVCMYTCNSDGTIMITFWQPV